MTCIHEWWKSMAGERFWLGVPGHDERCEVLATSRGPWREDPNPIEPLVTRVNDGDAVFLFDEAREAIVAWSIARGRVRKRNLFWQEGARSPHPDSAEPTLQSSWSIALSRSTPLAAPVTLAEIARVQWDLFPALRALEDDVGEPLYYPFSMGNRHASSLLPGGVFKLPALFVENFDSLAEVSRRMSWAAVPPFVLERTEACSHAGALA